MRCRKQHKGKEKVVRARGKRAHRARTAWCTARASFSGRSVEDLDVVGGGFVGGQLNCFTQGADKCFGGITYLWLVHVKIGRA